MKIQTVQNYATTNNYQIDKTNQQSSAKQQSFGKVIFDERGLERTSEEFRSFMQDMFSNIKSLIHPDILNSKDHDVLALPFRVGDKKYGIAVIDPRKDATGTWFSQFNFWNFLNLSPDNVARDIKTRAAKSATFPQEHNENYLWKIEIPLSEEEFQKRFPAKA